MIAEEIREKAGRKKYNPLFTEYYLPGMIPGSGDYATSHYNPDLEMKVMELMPGSNPPETDSEKSEVIFKQFSAAHPGPWGISLQKTNRQHTNQNPPISPQTRTQPIKTHTCKPIPSCYR